MTFACRIRVVCPLSLIFAGVVIEDVVVEDMVVEVAVSVASPSTVAPPSRRQSWRRPRRHTKGSNGGQKEPIGRRNRGESACLPNPAQLHEEYIS